MYEKIIQIMPAPQGLLSVYFEDDGTEHYVPVACLGLTEEGEVVLMDIDSTGYIDTTASNFKGIKWKDNNVSNNSINDDINPN